MSKKVKIYYKLGKHVYTLYNVFIDLGTMEIVDERSLEEEKNPICHNHTDGIEEDTYETDKINGQSMNYIKNIFCTKNDETNIEDGIILDGKIGWLTKTYG